MDVAGPADAGASADAAPNRDAANDRDTGLPVGRDAEMVRDAAPDAGARDSGIHDDAAAPPDSGETPDTGVPRDSGEPADSGAGDAGTQADGGCLPLPLAPGDPQLARQLTVGHTIDRAVLIADLDGDQQDEIAVASAAEQKLTVIDFEGCGQPRVVTETNVRIGSDGLVRMDRAMPRIITAGDHRIVAREYRNAAGGSIQQLGPPHQWQDATWLAADPSGLFLVASGRSGGGDTAYLTVDANQGTVLDTSVDPALNGRPAYFDHPPGQLPRFVGTDGRSGVILTPGSSSNFLNDGGTTNPNTSPVVARSNVLGPGHAVVVYGAESITSYQLRTARVSLGDVRSYRTSQDTLAAPLLNAPILMRRPLGNGDVVRVYYVLTSGVVAGCELDVGRMGDVACDDPMGSIGTISMAASETDPLISPITAYVNDDPIPDVVITLAAAGNIQFRQSALGMAAAAQVSLRAPVGGTPGISTNIFSAFGREGYVLAVPHRDGRISLVTWQHTAQHGSEDRLWLQHRGDASRSGSLD